VRLTPKGKETAYRTALRHHLIERMLAEMFGMEWYEVHDEAERLEHYISERLEDRIAAKLGDPEIDPHGHIIPEKDGVVAEREEVALSKWPCGVPAMISSVSDRDPNALREMKRMGLVPGTGVTVEPGTRHASLLVRVSGKKPTRVSRELASEIMVIQRARRAASDLPR
jgi:DtxR family Mn-dependent transcriptional regulator